MRAGAGQQICGLIVPEELVGMSMLQGCLELHTYGGDGQPSGTVEIVFFKPCVWVQR
jgi:hypothetical protein